MGKIPFNQGIRQGDSLSPLVFNIVMYEIIKNLRDLQGYPLGDENVNIICYADDAPLIADNEDDLQRLLNRFSHFLCKIRSQNITDEDEIPNNLKGTSKM